MIKTSETDKFINRRSCGRPSKSETIVEEPVETIRRMNPGSYIPTGEELAKKLKEKEKQ